VTFTYTLSKVKSEALHWLRWKVGDNRHEGYVIEDEELDAALLDHGLTATSDPQSNTTAVTQAAIDVCRAVAARLGRDSKITLTDVGPVKKNAAEFYLKLANQLEESLSVETTLAREGPHEEVDAIDYHVNRLGEDLSEYIGDPTG
jgi:hypothetical protein